MQLVDRSNGNGTFTNHELARLVAYRAAVAAGFYTDWDGSATSTDTELLELLHASDLAHTADTYPFTSEERKHLEECRAGVAAGRYRDDLPPASVAGPSEDASQ
jgi:hypothetical protein